MTPNISISEEARRHFREELSGKILRIAFTTGCGGSGYRLSSADEALADEIVVHTGEIDVALDDMAAKKLDGAVIEYDAAEDGYVLNHPDAVSAVWCG